MSVQNERSQTAIEYLLLIGAAVIFTIVVTLATRDIIFPAGEKLGILGWKFWQAQASFAATPTAIIPSIIVTAGGCTPGLPCPNPLQYCSGNSFCTGYICDSNNQCTIPSNGQCTSCGAETFINSTCAPGYAVTPCEASCTNACKDPGGVCEPCTPSTCDATCTQLPACTPGDPCFGPPQYCIGDSVCEGYQCDASGQCTIQSNSLCTSCGTNTFTNSTCPIGYSLTASCTTSCSYSCSGGACELCAPPPCEAECSAVCPPGEICTGPTNYCKSDATGNYLCSGYRCDAAGQCTIISNDICSSCGFTSFTNSTCAAGYVLLSSCTTSCNNVCAAGSCAASCEPPACEAQCSPASSCTLSAAPGSGVGPYSSTVTATFSNLEPGVTNALLKCFASDAGAPAAINMVTKKASIDCDYPAVPAPAMFEPRASAIGGAASCNAAIVDNPPSSCVLIAIPESGVGPFSSTLTAAFSYLEPGVSQALMKCSAADAGQSLPIDAVTKTSTRLCNYPAVANPTNNLASAAAIGGAASCTDTVTDNPSPSCINSCGISLSAPGYYELCSDVSTTSTTTPCVTITSSDVELNCNNYKMAGPSSNSGKGIFVNQVSRNVIIRNCNVFSFGTPLSISNSGSTGSITFKDSIISFSALVHILLGKNTVLENNRFNLVNGILIDSRGNDGDDLRQITGNLINISGASASSRGIWLNDERRDIISGNTFTQYGSASSAGARLLMLENSDFNTIENNIFEKWRDFRAVYLLSSDNNLIQLNTIRDSVFNENFLVFLESSGYNRIYRNNFNNFDLLQLAGIIRLYSLSSLNQVTENQIANHGGVGVSSETSNANNISSNTFSNGDVAVIVSGSNNVNITSNTISSYNTGVQLWPNSPSAKIIGNVMNSITATGVDVSSPNSNIEIKNNNINAGGCAVDLCDPLNSGCGLLCPLNVAGCTNILVNANIPNKCYMP
ncbi:MAG: right-handed parallel beta-helix repeat-containing protein [Candidatus Micrarchaeota archaeon]